MSEKDYILSIIAKQLRAQASEAEQQELQTWLQADASHQSEYDELAAIWQKSGHLLSTPAFDTQSAWLQMEEKMRQPGSIPTQQPTAKVISLLFIKRAAVAIVILAAISITAFWLFTRNQWQTFAATNTNELLTLPDHSTVHVRKGSTLRYPRSFAAKERRVQLTGEAFFEVQRNEQQPFRIETKNFEIKVLGTSFLVQSKPSADEIVVVTGNVQVQDKEKNSNQVVVPAGQRVVLQEHRFLLAPVTDSNFIAWKTGRLNFEDAPLQKVLDDVSLYYGVPVELEPGSKAAAVLHITVRFDNQPLEQALEEIRLIAGLAMKKENSKIIFYQK